MSDQKESLDSWLERLAEQEMPALGTTVRAIAEISADEEHQHVSRLADIIHQDAAMTMHVLRLTNGAYHIPRSKRLNTVNRALVMLGFNEVRSLCLTIAIVGQLLKGKPRAQVTDEMGRAFHAAVQARSLAFQRGDPAAEEIFTAALLYHIGEMAFWCFGGEKADEVIREVESGVPELEAQRNVLGFELRELTVQLSQKWGIGPLLQQAFDGAQNEDSRWRAVELGHKIAAAVSKGWDSEQLEAVGKEATSFVNLSLEQLMPTVRENAVKAIETAKSFGARIAGETIPPPPSEEAVAAAREASEAAAAEFAASSAPPSFLEPDPIVQLRILREIAAKLECGTDVNEILELILEGIYCGIGMDRALFALLSPNRRYLRAKTARGASTYYLMNKFKFDISPQQPNIFHFVIESQSALWVPDRSAAAIQKLIPQSINVVIGSNSPFFIAPTVVDGKPIGIFFADRHESGRDLDHEEYEAFKQFAIQADLALAHLDKAQERNSL
ncbi:MAG: HDOD domain-containing protein [Bdellovibrionales bacterium]|nr:HDOD domain-containing protein [Bdellovibrionales bacterium]